MLYDVSYNLTQTSNHDISTLRILDGMLGNAYHPSLMGFTTLSELSAATTQQRQWILHILQHYIDSGICVQYQQMTCGICGTNLGDNDSECANCCTSSEQAYITGETCYRVVLSPDHIADEWGADALSEVPFSNNTEGFTANINSVGTLINQIVVNKTTRLKSKRKNNKRRRIKDIMMIDPTTISLLTTTTLAVMRPYLEKAAEGFAKHLGEIGADRASDSLSKGRSVFQYLKQHFDKETAVAVQLDKLSANPDSEPIQNQLTAALMEEISRNREFATKLSDLTGLTVSNEGGTNFNTNIHGNVEKAVNIGNIENISGDFNL